jgi:hypothetical protein
MFARERTAREQTATYPASCQSTGTTIEVKAPSSDFASTPNAKFSQLKCPPTSQAKHAHPTLFPRVGNDANGVDRLSGPQTMPPGQLYVQDVGQTRGTTCLRLGAFPTMSRRFRRVLTCLHNNPIVETLSPRPVMMYQPRAMSGTCCNPVTTWETS